MLYLVRHGETAFNAERRIQGRMDTPLSPRGLAQAEALGEWLCERGFAFDAVYSSTLTRAKDTAAAVGKRLGLEPKAVEGLEEIDFGRFQGHTFDECARLYPEAYADRLIRGADSNAHGGETGEEVFLRARAALLGLPEFNGGCALVVCHGAVIGFLRAAVQGRPFAHTRDLIPKNIQLVRFGDEALERIRKYK
ncbi:MAG: histidine phosphatase family protein [Clostridia bacterium]|nr:histidine phosphatase family protein [Clostridia bacterium]